MLRPVILAGGSGTRLWPLSRKNTPKQFLRLSVFGGTSLFQQTLKRASMVADASQVRVVASREYGFHVLAQAQEYTPLDESALIVEPSARGTMAAIALAMRELTDDDTALIMPSDHFIRDSDAFAATIAKGMEISRTDLVTF